MQKEPSVKTRSRLTRRDALQLFACSTGAALLSRSGFAAQVTPGPVATTTYGQVRGYMDRDINAFKGIPYGDDTAPVRFQAPRPPQPWTGVKETVKWGPRAPQPGRGQSSASSAGSPADPVSEDCLYLNV